MIMQRPFTYVEVPDGKYEGKQGGYIIQFHPTGNGPPAYVQTKDGIRGMNVPVRFAIVEGKLVDESVQMIP